ncbi:CPBP family intramembrane glutamic endopeptidase [Roseofilum casamattae]|uniref:Type II CAAX endopeptidase family protein n=1 Tax=Roseofilum casamattae BLCC-M143 TaxID=3022442 RepID=A0ABT7BXK0_9CYAN|nr:type II CAAX endopeptidase family protein [Roseofilum casamattae]MDJ1183912.1 type II CAAX endopeptidase family protein [Roseofilum casamattae BLCC-M143]
MIEEVPFNEDSPSNGEHQYLPLFSEEDGISLEDGIQCLEESIQCLEDGIQYLEDNENFGLFLGIILTICLSAPPLNAILHRLFPMYDVYSMVFGWIYLLALLVPVLWLVWRFELNWQELGITTQNLRKSLIEGLTLGVAGIGCVLALAYCIESVAPSRQWFSRLSHIPITLSIVTYFAHSGIQEFITRGVLQSSLQRCFSDERGFYSIALASAIFGLFHIHFGLFAVAISFVASIFFGWVYLRTYNLVGVTVVHYLLGYIFLSTQAL